MQENKNKYKTEQNKANQMPKKCNKKNKKNGGGVSVLLFRFQLLGLSAFRLLAFCFSERLRQEITYRSLSAPFVSL